MNPKDHFLYEKLPVITEYFYEDGTTFSAYADEKKFAIEIEKVLGEPQENVFKFLKKSREIYRITADVFLKKSLHRSSTYLNRGTLNSLLQIYKIDSLRSMHQANKSFFKNPKVVQLFNRYATYNGSNPYEAPATLNVIPHLEFELGAYFPKGGMYSITKSLVKLAESLGVKFHFNSKIDKIIIQNGKAKGVQVNDFQKDYDLVVSNMDIVGTYKKLLTDLAPPKRLLNQPKSSSALIFYWGISESTKLDLHNIFFSKDYQTEFAHIFNKKTVYKDPTVYVNISSKYNASDAPENCENWFTMINVPNNSGQDWDELIPKAKQFIIDKLSRMMDLDVANKIVTESILEPRTIESKTSSAQGALYGNASNNWYAAFLRHANFSFKIPNLYFVGGSVHPGGGIPLSLLSAKIACDKVKEDFSK